MYSPLRPRRRGCLLGCAGCLFHHPITMLATFFGLVLWLPQLLHVSMYLLAGIEPNPWPLVWTTLLLFAAQLIPRITPMLYRAYLARRALVRDRQLAPTQAAIDPALSVPSSLRVSAGAGAAAQAAEWSVLGHAGGTTATQAATRTTPPWRAYRELLWTADANASTYYGSADDADFRAMVAGNTSIRLIPEQAPGSDRLHADHYRRLLLPSDSAALRSGEPGTSIRLYDSSPSEEHTDE